MEAWNTGKCIASRKYTNKKLMVMRRYVLLYFLFFSRVLFMYDYILLKELGLSMEDVM